jgi:hypothetical protein
MSLEHWNVGDSDALDSKLPSALDSMLLDALDSIPQAH